MDRACGFCGGSLADRRRDARFCSDTCRAKAHAVRKNSTVVPLPVRDDVPLEGVVLSSSPPDMGDVERLTRRDLEDAGKLDTPIGATCVALARRVDNPRSDTGSAMSSVAARLDELLSKATRGALAAGPAAAYEDEVAARRAGRGA